MIDSTYRGWEDQLESYLLDGEGKKDIIKLLEAPDPSVYHSFLINACQLSETSDLVIPAILLNPEENLNICDRILVDAASKVFKSLPPSSQRSCSPKPLLRFRLSVLPQFSEFVRSTVPKSEDVGMIVSLRGTAIKATMPKMLEFSKPFSCAKCGHGFHAQADYKQFYRLDKPAVCPNPAGCAGTNFNSASGAMDTNLELCRDIQEVKIQEQVGNLNLGTIPRSIWITLEDDLINACKPGDDVVVNGIVTRRWHPLGKSVDGRTDIGLVIKANYIQVNNEQRSSNLVTEELAKEFNDFWDKHKHQTLVARDQILASFCPQVYGLYAIKLALAVILCGGVERIDESGTRVRGEPHMLLVGDPGTGKSQLIRYASKLSSRAVLTTGVGSTSAGLTVSAVRDAGEWHLEAGALVLADGGICCIDEFNSIREADRTCIHEAMEQQSLSVAKAGLVCKLQTRCTVLAATNPKGRYDATQPLTVNTAIASPLLSRFDLVFVLLDSRNETWDRLVSAYVLQGKDPTKELRNDETSKVWSLEKLQAYFSFCKKFKPELSEEASEILATYYQRQRGSDDLSSARTTVRLLQSTIRLAQGHARLLCRSEVLIEDALFSVILLETSTDSSSSILNHSNPLHTTFPEDPMREYERQAEEILNGLGLSHLWAKEKARMERAHREEEEEQENVGGGTKDTVNVEAASEPSRPHDHVMTQVLSKLRTNQISYGEGIVVANKSRKRKQRTMKDMVNKKKRKRKRIAKEALEVDSDFEAEHEGEQNEDKERRCNVIKDAFGEDSDDEETATDDKGNKKSASASNDRSPSPILERTSSNEAFDKSDLVTSTQNGESRNNDCPLISPSQAKIWTDRRSKISKTTLDKLKMFESPAVRSRREEAEAVAAKSSSRAAEKDETSLDNKAREMTDEALSSSCSSEKGESDTQKVVNLFGETSPMSQAQEKIDTAPSSSRPGEKADKSPKKSQGLILPAVNLTQLKERMATQPVKVPAKSMFGDSDEDFSD